MRRRAPRSFFGASTATFGWDDFVDVINPLQHIPVIAQIYCAVTGDQAYGPFAFLVPRLWPAVACQRRGRYRDPLRNWPRCRDRSRGLVPLASTTGHRKKPTSAIRN